MKLLKTFKLTLIGAAALCAVLSVTAQAHGTPAALQTTTNTTTRTVFVIMMENHNWDSIKDSSSAPYINQTLLPMAAHTEQYYNPPGLHPSEPNYLWLEAGSNFKITNDSDPLRNHLSTTAHLTTLLDACAIMGKNFNPRLKVGGLFLTKYSASYRLSLHHDVVAIMRDNAVTGPLLMNTSIRQNGKLSEAQIEKQNLFAYAPTSNGAEDYRNLTTEILARL